MRHTKRQDAHHQGLQADVQAMLTQRRRALAWLSSMGGLATLGLNGCGGGGDAGTSVFSGSGSGNTSTSSTSGVGSCSLIPEETAGPYPGDGSNNANGNLANALALSGIVRSDIRSSVDTASGTAAGVPMTVQIQLVNVNNSCASLAGYALYLWHCDAQGRYSMYSSGVTSQNYLRGVQPTDSSGTASFTTIFPGCYSGRMPHMHFEVYRSETTATSYSNKLRTSQIAFPVATCQEVYNGASAYSSSIANLAAISFATDNVFSDGVSLELSSVSGNLSDGYVATITVGISV